MRQAQSGRGRFFEQRLREILNLERLQIVGLFADAHEFHRDIEFLLNGYDHAATAGSVEFRDDQARQRSSLMEGTHLVDGVHPGRRIQG